MPIIYDRVSMVYGVVHHTDTFFLGDVSLCLCVGSSLDAKPHGIFGLSIHLLRHLPRTAKLQVGLQVWCLDLMDRLLICYQSWCLHSKLRSLRSMQIGYYLLEVMQQKQLHQSFVLRLHYWMYLIMSKVWSCSSASAATL